MSEAIIYQVSRWDCPECGEVNESDADFNSVELCGGCREKVSLR